MTFTDSLMLIAQQDARVDLFRSGVLEALTREGLVYAARGTLHLTRLGEDLLMARLAVAA